MSSLSRLGIGLLVVFGCFFLALLAEIYYVFWRRRRLNSPEMNGGPEDSYAYSSPSRELLYLLCWRKQGSMSTRALNHGANQVDSSSVDEFGGSPDTPLESDFMTKFFSLQAEGMDSEVMRIHSLLGPPRLLFTIKEETKEDMDSEDGKSMCGKRRRGSSLSDLFGSGTVTPLDTPFMTPSSSPTFHTPVTTPPLTPIHIHPALHAHKVEQPGDADPHSSSPLPNNPESGSAEADFSLDVPLQKSDHLLQMDDGSLSNSGDESAAFITIFVNDDSHRP